MTAVVMDPQELAPPMDSPNSPVSAHSTGSGFSSTASSTKWWARAGNFTGRSDSGKVAAPKQASHVNLEEQQAILKESVEGDVNLLRRRPERICIVSMRSSRESDTGLRFREVRGKIIVDSIESGSFWDVQNPASKPFFEHDQDADCNRLLQAGDIVESINGWDLGRSGTPVSQVTQHWEELTGEICLTVSTREGVLHSGLCQLVLVQPNKDSIVESVDLIPTKQQEEVGEAEAKEVSVLDIGLQLVQRQGLLQVQGLTPQSCLVRLGGAMSPIIEPGDFVVAMATTLCAALEAKDAQLLWQMQVESSCQECLSLMTVRATEAQRRWNRLRKAAVAGVGGTLVGLGGIMLATPLHPVGHAVTLGGVGVLGSEFEGPRKAFEAARNSFKRKESSPNHE